MLCTNARSIGRRFLAENSGSFFLRSASVGLPSPVHTNASSARRATRSGCSWAKSAARSAPEEMPYTSSFPALEVSRMYSLPAARSSAPFGMSQLIGRDLSERPSPSLSMHQVSKPRAVNQYMTDELGRQGTFRSKVGWETLDEP